jgi:hypothetical protein
LRLDRALHAVSAEDGRLARTAGATLKPLIPTSLRHGLRRAVRRRLLYGAPKPPDEELMLELRRRFLPEVLALQEHLARDLTRLWGYDRLT